MFQRRGINRDGSAGSAQNVFEDSPVSGGMPKNNSDNCLTIQVPLYDTTDTLMEPRKSHSSPSRHPLRPRRYSQGAVLVGPHFSVLSNELVNTSASPSPWSYDTDLLRHSTDNLRDITSDSSFPSTAQLLDQESSSITDGRKKVLRTPHERLNKLAKRHWPEDHLIPLDDICESPLVKTPNEPAQWSAEHRELHSTTATLFALDSVNASLHLDKGWDYLSRRDLWMTCSFSSSVKRIKQIWIEDGRSDE